MVADLGDMNLLTVHAINGHASLQADGSIIDYLDNQQANISATDIRINPEMAELDLLAMILM